jgi:GxxExxY protein
MEESVNADIADAPPIAAANQSREWMDALTSRIIGAAYKVSSALGSGFLEKVYENALALELRHAGVKARKQQPVKVRYRGEVVGSYLTDLLVEEAVVVEIKAVDGLDESHRAQCIHYLRATGLRVCLLLNFGRPRLELRRIVRNF